MARDALTRCPFCNKRSPAEDAHLPKSHKATCAKRKAAKARFEEARACVREAVEVYR